MPTEAFRIADSQDATQNGGYGGTRISRTYTGEYANHICSAVYDALLDAGWELRGGTKASWSLALPFGLPIADPPSPPLVSFPEVYGGPNPVVVDGVAFHFYDPFRVLPSMDVGPAIEWVEAGLTIDDSIGNLAAAIESKGWVFTGYHSDTSYPYLGWLHLDFEAPEVGLTWNGSLYGGTHSVGGGVTSNWYWGLVGSVGPAGAQGNAPAGGGVTLRSSQGVDTWVDVEITIPSSGTPNALFLFSNSADPAAIAVRAIAPNVVLVDSEGDLYPFRIWANQFQFFTWLDAPLSVGRSRQLFCIHPQLATDHGVESAAIVGNDSREFAEWTNAQAALNSGFTRAIGTYDYLGLKPGWLSMRFAGLAIRDTLLRHVVQTAFLSAPPDLAPNNASGQARVCGIAWDAVLVGGVYDLGSKVVFLSNTWECIGSYSGSGSELSLWVIDPGDE